MPDAPDADAVGVDCRREGLRVGDGVVQVFDLLHDVRFGARCAVAVAVTAVVVHEGGYACVLVFQGEVVELLLFQ